MLAVRSSFRLLFSTSLFLAITFIAAPHVAAQTTAGFVNNITAVPVPGVGHDYLHDLNEIVNPANGSLSVRIEAPRPKERGLNYPLYSFLYDSTQQFTIQYNEDTGGSYSCGPDSAGDGASGAPPQPLNCILQIDFPYRTISYETGGYPAVLSGPNSLLSSPSEYSRLVNSSTFETCELNQGYSYEDPYGVIHDLGVYAITQGLASNNVSVLPGPSGRIARK